MKLGTVVGALRDRLDRLWRERANRRLADELDEIALRASRRPVLDARQPEEILGYNETGSVVDPHEH